jgi:hypothetical protein
MTTSKDKDKGHIEERGKENSQSGGLKLQPDVEKTPQPQNSPESPKAPDGKTVPSAIPKDA